MRIDKNTLRGRIRNWVTALFLASFATLAGCNNEGRSQEVELRYWPSLRQQVYDFLFAGDNYVIRLHVYDDVTPLPSSTRSLVHSIGSVEFSVPKRAVKKNITSGGGDKDVLPLLFLCER